MYVLQINTHTDKKIHVCFTFQFVFSDFDCYKMTVFFYIEN